MAWNKSSENGYVVGKTADVVSVATTTQLNSDAITEDLSGKKIMVGVEYVIAGDNVVADLEVWASPDGTNYAVVAADVIADTTPNVAGTRVAQADLSSVTAPYYKLVFNAVGNDVDTVGRFKFIYAVKE
tara:strand:- start:561 stop:947 length:387 start_codon:yes stop_codon:yes gene_type:complete